MLTKSAGLHVGMCPTPRAGGTPLEEANGDVLLAEMPTSGDLKSGDCLFFTSPRNFNEPEKLTQPPMGMT